MLDSAPQRPKGDLNVYFGGFHRLMPFRVQHVLLVSSLYESFILEEDGLLGELITSQYVDMHLSHAPRVSRASTAEEALDIIQNQSVDLVITMTRFGEAKVARFAEQVKGLRPKLPVIALADEPQEILRMPHLRECQHIERVFVWNGDARILLAIIKYIEDSRNAEHDTRVGDVRVILVIENSVRFYSTYLPLIYTEVVSLTRSLLAEGINLTHQLLRMRARPRILLAETFEEAWDVYTRFSANMLGLISDVRFPRGGQLDSRAGLELTRRVRMDAPYLPVLLQSSDESYRRDADALSAAFIHKQSPSLLQELREFMQKNMGFGEFVFTLTNGAEVGRAADVIELEQMLSRVPAESIGFHASHNHFSNWLMARTEFDIAARISPVRVTDFATLEDLRHYLISTMAEFREKHYTGVISDFVPRKFDLAGSFTRIGGGSIGGKARGLAFMNALLSHTNLRGRHENVRLFVPNSTVLGTDVFDAFMDANDLRRLVSQDAPEHRLTQEFVRGNLPADMVSNVTAFLRSVRYPLAVRSSSLLEDSHGRPFAGVYATYMLPNNHPDLRVRIEQLCDAIKLVYASAYFRSAKRYLEATGHHVEEEKMGVILQELVGSEYGGRFYPTFSGVARSYNFYPTGQITPDEGVACVALGLGKTVVEGGEYLLFSPAHPHILPQFPTTDDLLANSQRRFYALDTSNLQMVPTRDADANLLLLDLDAAERDGTLAPIGSVYSPENDMVYDGIQRPGPRVVTFAHVLKSDLFPLADIVQQLLAIGQDGMASPVEIEFAVDMSTQPMEFGFLQIRPVASNEEMEAVRVGPVNRDKAVCYSPEALGNGLIRGIADLVFVRPEDFDSSLTQEIAAELGRINEGLRKAGRVSVFIGPGRWGSADRWLGIPVTWDQISTARIIVETTLPDLMVAPSQGTHFFQNLTSLGVGYLTVDPNIDKGFIDWDWLSRQPTIEQSRHVRHVRLEEPLEARIDGRNQAGVIFKPGDSRT